MTPEEKYAVVCRKLDKAEDERDAALREVERLQSSGVILTLNQTIKSLNEEVSRLTVANNELRALNVAGHTLEDWSRLTSDLKEASDELQKHGKCCADLEQKVSRLTIQIEAAQNNEAWRKEQVSRLTRDRDELLKACKAAWLMFSDGESLQDHKVLQRLPEILSVAIKNAEHQLTEKA